MSLFLKYLSIYAFSSVKFIMGPTLGVTYGFTILETGILTTLGMMTTVYLLTYFYKYLDRIFFYLKRSRRPKKKFTRRNRAFVKIWNKYGVVGVSFLTPILFTPIGGVVLANLFSRDKRKIVFYMWIFNAFWSFLISAAVKYGSFLILD